jgi:hypothetical protein
MAEYFWANRYRRPHIVCFDTCPDENERFRFISDQLSEMETQVRNVAASLTLFDNCAQFEGAQKEPEVRALVSQWRFVAARDSAMCMYHFANAMNSVRAWLEKSTTLGPITDTEALGAAAKSFYAAFPDYAKVRHAVAHAEDLRKNPAKLAENSYTGPIDIDGLVSSNGVNVSQFVIANTLIDRRYMATIEGKIVGHDVTRASYDVVAQIQDTFFKVFGAAMDALRHEEYRRTAKGGEQ